MLRDTDRLAAGAREIKERRGYVLLPKDGSRSFVAARLRKATNDFLVVS